MSNAAITANFGATVRGLRFRLGISQEELAERANLHRAYIAGIERGGRNVTLKSAARLAGALEVSIVELLAPGDEKVLLSGRNRRNHVTGQVVDILLVEDNPDDVELTLEAFRQVKIANRIHVAPDGAAALEYLSASGTASRRGTAELPQLILLDLQLPKISGFDVLRRLKRDARTRNIPVIVLTASQNSRDIGESRRLGAETYIVKPVDFYNFSQVTPHLRFQWALFEPRKTGRARTAPTTR